MEGFGETEAVMEKVGEYSGVVSVSGHRRGEKSVRVAARDFHSLPTNPVISHESSYRRQISLLACFHKAS